MLVNNTLTLILMWINLWISIAKKILDQQKDCEFFNSSPRNTPENSAFSAIPSRAAPRNLLKTSKTSKKVDIWKLFSNYSSFLSIFNDIGQSIFLNTLHLPPNKGAFRPGDTLKLLSGRVPAADVRTTTADKQN